MKVKLLVLFLIPLLTISCDDSILTKGNYSSETALFAKSLATDAATISVEIKRLEDIIESGQGDENTQELLDDRSAELKKKAKEIAENNQRFIDIDLDIDVPCPDIITDCDPQLQYIIYGPHVIDIQIEINDNNGNVSASQGMEPLPDNPKYRYTNIDVSKFSGTIKMTITKTDVNNIRTTYDTEFKAY